ncbi:hypothetical protein BDP67DRAFT_178107 [Colletotrichum lupini]|nr:hypothetical protein BDP67DRAFT_178107 [Colletotrichum lupini]
MPPKSDALWKARGNIDCQRPDRALHTIPRSVLTKPLSRGKSGARRSARIRRKSSRRIKGKNGCGPWIDRRRVWDERWNMPSKPYYSLLQPYAPWNLRWAPCDLPLSEAQGLVTRGMRLLFFPSSPSINQSTRPACHMVHAHAPVSYVESEGKGSIKLSHPPHLGSNWIRTMNLSGTRTSLYGHALGVRQPAEEDDWGPGQD